MKDENGPAFPNSDYRRSNWCDSNRDIIEALMASKNCSRKQENSYIKKKRKAS
jgi:hypothetical protein